jgi:hypothetical protein
MILDTSFFPAILAQDFVPYDPNQDEYALAALLGSPSADQMGDSSYPDLTPPPFDPYDFHDFSEQYQVPADLSVSPGTISTLSLPSSPFSFADDLSEPGVVDAPTPCDPNASPTGLSVLIALVDIDDVKPPKTDLENFEYNPFTRKWVCTKCGEDFVSTHEARRHLKTAAKCTGKKVHCLRCGDNIHASQWSRKRHFVSKKCQKGGRKRGTPTYTVHNAYVEL